MDAVSGRSEMSIVLKARPFFERVISGRVTDREGKGLNGASVQWIHSWGEHKGREITVTDRKGRYRLSFESEKETHTISVFAEGYAPLIRGAVATGVPGRPAQVDFILEDGHWLAGRVVAEGGEPVPGAVVKAMPSLDWLRNPTVHPGVVRKGTTDEDGRFEMRDVAGPTVAIQLKGPEGGNWGHNVNENVLVDSEVELQLLSFGVIRGRIVDDDTGEPVPGFTIRIAGARGYLDYARTRPGELFDSPDGSFILKKLDQEPHDLWIEPEGYLSLHVAKITPEREAVASVHEFRVSRGRPFAGTVFDEETSFPLAGVKVVFGVWGSKRPSWSEWAWGEMANRQEVVTGEDGAFEFIESDSGTLFILAADHARRSITPHERQSFDDGSGRLRVPLSKGAVLAGIHYQDGKPCSTGFFLPMLVRRERTPDSEAEVELLDNIRRDADGRFRVESLRPGTYFLDHYRETPKKATRGLAIRRRISIAPGKETFVEYGKDFGPFLFTGRLLDSTGRPLDGVHLVLRPEFEWPYVKISAPVDRKHAGRFWFTGLKPGTYQVEVTRDGRSEPPIRLPSIDLTGTIKRDLVVATD